MFTVPFNFFDVGRHTPISVVLIIGARGKSIQYHDIFIRQNICVVLHTIFKRNNGSDGRILLLDVYLGVRTTIDSSSCGSRVCWTIIRGLCSNCNAPLERRYYRGRASRRQDTCTPIAGLTMTGVPWTWRWRRHSICGGHLEGNRALVPNGRQRRCRSVLLRADLIAALHVCTVASCAILAQGVVSQITIWVDTFNGRTRPTAGGNLTATGGQVGASRKTLVRGQAAWRTSCQTSAWRSVRSCFAYVWWLCRW